MVTIPIEMREPGSWSRWSSTLSVLAKMIQSWTPQILDPSCSSSTFGYSPCQAEHGQLMRWACWQQAYWASPYHSGSCSHSSYWFMACSHSSGHCSCLLPHHLPLPRHHQHFRLTRFLPSYAFHQTPTPNFMAECCLFAIHCPHLLEKVAQQMLVAVSFPP